MGRHQFKTNFQVAVLIASLLFSPIVEELAFRHFILSVRPFNASVWMGRSLVGALRRQNYAGDWFYQSL